MRYADFNPDMERLVRQADYNALSHFVFGTAAWGMGRLFLTYETSFIGRFLAIPLSRTLSSSSRLHSWLVI